MVSSSTTRGFREELATLNHQRQVRVLHVDDEADFADLVSIYLERENDTLDVVTEPSPEAGLERLETEDIDCIVSDYDMPRTNGLEFLDAVREDHPELPFILFTGKGSEEIASEAISTGATDYIQKEEGTDQYAVLANRIGNVVQRYHAGQEVKRGFHAIETAREGIAFLDEAGTFLYVNPAYAETYGYDREELVGEHWEILYPDEHVSQVYDEILPSVPVESRWSGESIHLDENGNRMVVNHALSYCSEGTLLCFIRDITEQKEMERALEQERQRFELFVDAVEDYAIFSLDTEGFITSWNSGARRLKGYDEDEIVGEHVSVFYPEEKVEEGYPERLLATALDEGSVEDTGWRVRKDGSTFWGNVVITAAFDDDGHHQGFLKVTREMTQEREARRALEAEKDFLDRALNVLEDIFYVIDSEENIVRVTDRAAEVTGYSRDELLSMAPSDLFPPEERHRIRENIQEAFETGSAAIETRVLTDDGRTVPFDFRTRRVTDAEGNVVLVGIGRDISERKRRERQLERQLNQFEQFGNVLSHDLRTPLTTAQGRLELAQETGDEEHLRQAETALERLDDLIEDLSSVMREGELVGEMTAVELEGCIRSIVESLETDEATVTVEVAGSIQANEEALKRLLENLFRNALEHAGENVHVTVGPLADGFYIEDDGPGIPEADRERVFEAGYSTKENGDGFGMASVRQLVFAHGWDIVATEGENGGARFEITDVDTE